MGRWRRRAAKAAAPDHPTPEAPQPVILVTYETTEDAIRAALEGIEADGHIASTPQMIRIEPLS